MKNLAITKSLIWSNNLTFNFLKELVLNKAFLIKFKSKTLE